VARAGRRRPFDRDGGDGTTTARGGALRHLEAWDQPDLTWAKAHASSRYRDWDRYVPYLELVQCGGKIKPALFFKIGYADFGEWATAVEPVEIRWNWYRTKSETPYVVIDFHVLFINRNGATIGVGGAGQATITTPEAHRHSHRLTSRTLLDPAEPAHREVIEAWATAPAPTVLFFVEEHFQSTAYVWMDLRPEGKQTFLETFSEATEELKREEIVPGSFPDACVRLQGTLPRVSWWKD
jgi:hypothetical protein